MGAPKRIINVAGRQVEVSSVTPKANQIIRAMGEGKDRQLVLHRPNGSQEIVPGNKRVELKEGEVLDAVPTWTLG